MSATRIQAKPRSWLWGTLTSIRLTVFLLLILAALAVIGTVVPQNQAPATYRSLYGPVWGKLLLGGGFTDVYFSPWFLLPISLLGLNILACVIHGLPRALRRALTPLSPEKALALPERGHLSWPAGVDPHPDIDAALREVGRFRREQVPDAELYFLERGRCRPLGPYLIHVALLLILAGGFIGKFWGVDGRLALDQGQVAAAFQLGPHTEKPLDFQVRLDRFQVSFYKPGGTPKEFRSDLTFLKDGRAVSRATCRVNDPVSFGGLTFYQSSYGSESTGPILLRLKEGSVDLPLKAPYRQPVQLPGGRGLLFVMRVDGNLQGYGPAVLLAVKAGPGHPRAFWALKDHPGRGEQPGPFRLTVESVPFKYYSVFQVRRDPGVWWVYTGFLLFLPGLYLAFFRPAERWALVLAPTPEGTWQARLLGSSPRRREEFAARQERLLTALTGGTPS